LLVLPMLLTGDLLHARDRSKRTFRVQSLVLVALVFCIMASAMHRMRLYQYAYGLTELRFYVTAFMIFLAVVFALFCITVLRDLRGLFAMGTVAIGFAAIFVLHVANPDQWIARANLANARAGRIFDPAYLKALSSDAVPVVMQHAVGMDSAVLDGFLDHETKRLDQTDDWRSWNYGRYKARSAIRTLARKGAASVQ
jgi:two-component system sensor histidine kinase BaeS